MRLLLISDTHGKLGIIDELASHVRADAVIHAGDFGFYDDGSYGRLSTRELRLQVIHSDLPRPDKEEILDLSPDERSVAAREILPLSEFPAYVEGRKNFRVPVYAVWGNHEDKDVVERLFRGDIRVKNLHILHHRRTYKVGPVLVYGLGGNFLAGSKLLQRPIAGGAGKIWSTLAQYFDLIETLDREADRPGLRIFVSHVSPGKEPFMELVGARTRADFTISGHMGAPTCLVWNPFAVSSLEEAEKRLRNGLDAVRNACTGNAGPVAKWAEQAFSVLGRIPEDTIDIGRGIKAPRWYRGMTHVNLADALILVLHPRLSPVISPKHQVHGESFQSEAAQRKGAGQAHSGENQAGVAHVSYPGRRCRPLLLLHRPEPLEQAVGATGRRFAADGRSSNPISAYLFRVAEETGMVPENPARPVILRRLPRRRLMTASRTFLASEMASSVSRTCWPGTRCRR